MLNFNGNRRIFLARAPIDMRKGAGTVKGAVRTDVLTVSLRGGRVSGSWCNPVTS